MRRSLDGAIEGAEVPLPYKLHRQDAIVAGPDGRLYFG